MDKKIEKKKWTRKKIMYIAGAVLFILLMFFGFKSFNEKTYKAAEYFLHSAASSQ